MIKVIALSLVLLSTIDRAKAPSWVSRQASQGSGPFSDLSIDEALELASRERRMLLLAFYSEDCAACRKWDETVFADDEVRGWISKSAVALRLLDASELDARHAIGVRPTILILGPEGEEVERLDELVEPRPFLAIINTAVEAGSGYEAERRRHAEARDQVSRGRELAGNGEGAEALEQFLLAFDGMRDVASWSDARLGGLLIEIAMLLPTVPEARAALAHRRDRAQVTLTAPQDQPVPVGEMILCARELAALDRTLGDNENLRGVWLQLRQRPPTSPRVLEALFSDNLQMHLLDTRRFQEFLSGVEDPLATLEQHLSKIQGRMPEVEGDNHQRSLLTAERNAAINLAGRCYEALLGVENWGEADDLAELLLALEPRAQSYLALTLGAKRAAQPQRVAALVDRGLATLPDAERRTLSAFSKSLLGTDQ